jgi:hypothetical protein
MSALRFKRTASLGWSELFQSSPVEASIASDCGAGPRSKIYESGFTAKENDNARTEIC